MVRKEPDDQYSPEEIARRRDAVLKAMINTPPTPHKAARLKGKGKRANKKPAKSP
jgi:hypothetical protein